MSNQKQQDKQTPVVVLASKADILKTKERMVVEEVFIKSLGKKVYVAKMNVLLSDVYEGSLIKVVDDGKGNQVIIADLDRLKTKLVAATLVDKTGKPMFTLEELGEVDPEVVNEIFEHAERLNGKGGAQEEIVKN